MRARSSGVAFRRASFCSNVSSLRFRSVRSVGIAITSPSIPIITSFAGLDGVASEVHGIESEDPIKVAGERGGGRLGLEAAIDAVVRPGQDVLNPQALGQGGDHP